MEPDFIKVESLKEFETPERCSIAENWSSPDVSIARARVKPGVTTLPHHLKATNEIYLIVRGVGKARIGKHEPVTVKAGDTVFIPAGTSQQITNTGKSDLVFYCVCTPRFTQECYQTEKP